MRHLDLFSGIGGFALATEMVWGKDMEHIFCEIDPFCQAILKKHWPNAPIYHDIRTLTADSERFRYFYEQPKKQSAKSKLETLSKPLSDIPAPFLLTGGFPCQPFSQAGRRRGTEDDRYLWPEMLRVIREFHPRWVIGENVGGLVTWNNGMVLEQVHTDLESEGYSVQAFVIPAVAVNAPHRRDRVWIVAHNRQQYGSKGRDEGMEGHSSIRTSRKSYIERRSKDDTNTKSNEAEQHKLETKRFRGGLDRKGGGQGPDWNENWSEVATRLCRVDDGIPRRLDRNPRLKALGNAIVPQVAAEIMKAIKHLEKG